MYKKGEYMKKLLTISILFSMISVMPVYAGVAYTNDDESETLLRQHHSEHVSENREVWNQTINSYQANYNDSMKKYWDAYTEAYQKQKRIQH